MKKAAYNFTAQHSTAQHSTAQHSTAQHSTAQHSIKSALFTASKKPKTADEASGGLFSSTTENTSRGVLMDITAQQKIELKRYIEVFKMTAQFAETVYFEEFVKMLDNKDWLKKIFDANDVWKIPPTLTFIQLNKEFFESQVQKHGQLSRSEKAGINRCFQFLFCVLLGYKEIDYRTYDKEKNGDTGITKAYYYVKKEGGAK